MSWELDEQIAFKVMGWVLRDHNYWTGPGTEDAIDLLSADAVLWSRKWRPSEDRNACALAEARIVEMGLGNDYVEELREIGIVEFPLFARSRYLWMITAPPEVRCRAMLAALVSNAEAGGR